MSYAYGHEHNEPEENSSVRLYLRSGNGAMDLLGEAHDAKSIEIPELPVGMEDDEGAVLWLAVVPRTRFASGREYFAEEVFPVTNVVKTARKATGSWSPAPLFTISQSQDRTTTLLRVVPRQWPRSEQVRFQLHVLGQDGSFQLLRDLIGENVFVLDRDYYDTVRISVASGDSDSREIPRQSMLLKLKSH